MSVRRGAEGAGQRAQGAGRRAEGKGHNKKFNRYIL